MADKRVRDLPKIGTITDSTLFVVEKNDTAYHATAAQVKALVPSGEGGGESGGTGSSAYYLDLTGSVVVDSAGESQLFSVTGIGDEGLLSAEDVVLKFMDSGFAGVEMEALRSNVMWGADAGSDLAAVMFFTHTNPYTGTAGSFRVRLVAQDDGTFNAVITYWPDLTGAVDFADVANNPVKVSEDGYTEIENERQVTAIDFTNWTDDFTGSFTVTLQGGVTTTVTQGSDASGNKTLSVNGNTVTLVGV